MPWMKVLRKPRLNRAVVRVAVDTAANFSRLLSLSDLFSLSDMVTPFSIGRLRPPGGLSILVAKRLGLYTSAKLTDGHLTEQRPPDAAHRPASSAARCRPSAAQRVRSVNGPQDSGRLQ